MVKVKSEDLEKKIQTIKQELQEIGKMRPGSLTRQLPASGKGKGYYQISYTYRMRSRTEYVRPEFVQLLKKQIKEFKRFKRLVQEWIDCALEISRAKMNRKKHTGAGKNM